MHSGLSDKRLSKGRFRWWPEQGESRSLEAHQAQLLLAAGNPDEAEGAPAKTYTVEYDTAANVFHYWGLVKDPNGVSEKYWTFGYDAASATTPYAGLLLYQRDIVQGTGAIPRLTVSYWSLDARGNRYIGATDATIDYGMAFAKTARTEQMVDIYGNLTSNKAFHFGNLTTPRTHHVVTYLNSAPYTQRFILNRATGTSVSYNGAAFVGLTAAAYDNYAGNTLTPRTGLGLHDTANYGSSMLIRGNPTVGGVANGYNTLVAYDVSGFAISGANGSTSTAATPDSKNAVATVLTPNSDPTKAMSMGFNSIYQVTSVQGPNGTSTSIGYDANARPTTTTGPHGAVTTFAYDDVNRVKTATTGTRWAKTYFDGFGRTIREESGFGSTTVSKVATEYDSCGCSPLGKMKRVSRPYSVAAPTHWTEYDYDSIGRVVSVRQGVPALEGLRSARSATCTRGTPRR